MSKNKGFFSEIKNQVKTGIGLVITAGFGLLIANMQSIFEPKEEVQQPPMMEQTINIPEGVKDTLIITKTIKIKPVKPKKRRRNNMVRLFLIISLLLSFTANAQLGKTETENYKGKFEQEADIDEVSDYMLDYQLPIQVLNIGFTPELYEFYPELRENRVGLGVSNITLSYLEWTDRFLFTEDKEDIKQRMVKQHKAAAKGISSNDIKVVGNVVLAEYFVYVEIYDYSVSEEEEVTVNGVKTVLKTIIGMQVRFVNAETGTIFTGSGSGEAVTIKRSQIGEDNIVKFNKSTIGIATKKALESGTARIVKRMIKRGIFKE